MGFYNTSEQLYSVIERVFNELINRQSASTGAIEKIRLFIRLQITQPEVVVNINGRQNPAVITYGEKNTRPDIEIGMTGDVLHLILLDQLSIKKAFVDKKLLVKGPFWKTGNIGNIFVEARDIYPAVLKERGLI